MKVKGRIGETHFESNMTGSLLTNAHSYSSVNGPMHFLPVNGYNYSHAQAPATHLRATSTGNVSGFYDTNLRSNAASWYVGLKRVIGGTTTYPNRYMMHNRTSGFEWGGYYQYYFDTPGTTSQIT